MTTGSYWRDKSRKVISKVIAENTEEFQTKESMDRLMKAIHDAYPFGERKYHPYKIWLDEVNLQLKMRGWEKRRKRYFGQTKKHKNDPSDPNQMALL